MFTPHLNRHLSPALLCLALGGALLSGLLAPAARSQENGDPLLTTAELRTLERENAMWRLVRPGDSVEENIARIGAAGFTPGEVAALQPRLAAMWDVPVERNFGWLHEDTVRQIREIDRQFIGRMRTVRLHEATGIRPGGKSPGSVSSLTRLWRGAVFKVLDYDEIAEFRLMNSASAREVGRLVEGLKLSDDELRTLSNGSGNSPAPTARPRLAPAASQRGGGRSSWTSGNASASCWATGGSRCISAGPAPGLSACNRPWPGRVNPGPRRRWTCGGCARITRGCAATAIPW